MTPNRVITISNVDQLLRWWGLFLEGREYFGRKFKWKVNATDFMRSLCQVLSLGSRNGFIGVLVSGAGQPYGFVVASESRTILAPDAASLWLIYSNLECPSTYVELFAEAQAWAKASKFKTFQACSHKLSGASVRFFQQKMGCDEQYNIFVKRL